MFQIPSNYIHSQALKNIRRNTWNASFPGLWDLLPMYLRSINMNQVPKHAHPSWLSGFTQYFNTVPRQHSWVFKPLKSNYRMCFEAKRSKGLSKVFLTTYRWWLFDASHSKRPLPPPGLITLRNLRNLASLRERSTKNRTKAWPTRLRPQSLRMGREGGILCDKCDRKIGTKKSSW